MELEYPHTREPLLCELCVCLVVAIVDRKHRQRRRPSQIIDLSRIRRRQTRRRRRRLCRRTHVSDLYMNILIGELNYVRVNIAGSSPQLADLLGMLIVGVSIRGGSD